MNWLHNGQAITCSAQTLSIQLPRYHIINTQLHLRLRNANILLVALPQIHKQPKRAEPEIICAHAHLNGSVIIQARECDFIIHAPCVFFAVFSLSSLSMFRAVPLNMASVMAFLYAASSSGEVSSSTSSSLSRSRGASLFLRL